MIRNTERIRADSEIAYEDSNKHPLEEMPAFDPEAAARQVAEAKNKLSTESQENNDFSEESDDCYDAYSAVNLADSLEQSNAPKPKYDKILANPNKLKKMAHNYLEQYEPNSQASADFLYHKDLMDHYVIGQLSGSNAKNFVTSEEFKNYASYIIKISQRKSQKVGDKTFYPELSTNPIFRNPEYRKLILSKAMESPEKAKKANRIIVKNQAEYEKTLVEINGRLERGETVLQDELDTVGDFLYTGRQFGSKLAKNFACYMFNEAKYQQSLKSSTQIGGALANYFAYKDTLDDRLKNSRVIIANNAGWNSRNKTFRPVQTGVSTNNYCVLEQNRINNISLSSENGLELSRPKTFTDLYSLMLVTFHELTHDYQKLMVDDGESSSTAMSTILNRVLRRDPSHCYPVASSKLNPVFDKNGKQIKTDYYKANHDSDEVEIEADEEAWIQCRKFIYEHEIRYNQERGNKDRENLASNRYWKCDTHKEEVTARRIFALKVDDQNHEMPYIQFDIQHLCQGIKQKPEFLQQFPQLSEYFNKDGQIKPEIFFNKRIASYDLSGLDILTDNFGVEIATYALMSTSNSDNILSYIQNSNNNLNEKQIERCIENLYHVLHQDAIKIRALDDLDFNSYEHTSTRGKNIEPEKLKKIYFNQYLRKLYNYARITEGLKKRYPGPNFEKKIDIHNFEYTDYYLDDFNSRTTLDANRVEQIKNYYQNSGIGLLEKVANKL